jgi:TonB family protein
MRVTLLAFAYTAVLAVAPFAVADSKAPRTGEPVLGPAYFDPQGADFTAWVNQFKNQLYEHWVLPPATPEGRRLRVKVELTVERSGAVSRVRVLEGSRNADFDQAAQAAVRGARFLPLPKAFPAASLTIELPFTYASKKHK